MSKLPVSILIPVRNEAATLQLHLDSLRPLFSQVEEVIAIDSESEDGSLEMLENALDFPGGRVLRRPRGLYEAWNFGVRESRSEFVYFATAGDLLLDGGLEHLRQTALDHRADVVISPPKMVGENPPKWPVHHLFDILGKTTLLDSGIKTVLNFGFELGRGLLGSSASNLYRRDFLVKHPFPEDCGHGGDTIWACRYAEEARVAFTPMVCANFAFEERNIGYGSLDQDLVYRVVLQCLEEKVCCTNAGPAIAAFLCGRREVNKLFLESLATQKQQFAYIGELKSELEKRANLIEVLDKECRRLQEVTKTQPRGLLGKLFGE
jgi:glycosyltransferase involved in cell wall biosynthesis